MNEGGNSLSTCTELLSIIAFAGIFARILSEFDHSGDFADRKVVEDIEDNFIQIRCRRDFRKEIYQLSIYASKALQGRIVGDYDWVSLLLQYFSSQMYLMLACPKKAN